MIKNEQMNIYIVTSTVITGIGYVDPQKRFFETIETIASIRRADKNSYIILIDNSTVRMSPNDEKILEDIVDNYLYVGDRKQCIEYNKNGVRSAGEAFILLIAFDLIKITITREVNRIFKVSGRYKLTDGFDISEYNEDQYKGKYCFKAREITERHPDGNCFFHTRLWSFCYSLLDDAILLIRNSMRTVLEQEMHIEKAIFMHINRNILIEKDVIHCEGTLALWDEKISE